MSDHPSADTLRRYRARALETADLLAVSDHVAACPECQAQIADPGAMREAVLAIRTAAENADSHPDFDALAAFVDGTLPAAEGRVVAAHAEECAECREDLDDLRAERERMTPVARAATVEAFRPRRRRTILWDLAVAATLLGGVAWVIGRMAAPVPGVPHEQSAPVAQSAATLPADEAKARIVVLDHGRRISLDADGGLHGLDGLTPADARATAQALITGRLDLPASLASLTPEAGVLMGEAATASSFRTLGPKATLVESDRPTLRWSPQPGATMYEVSVFDASLARVASSGSIRGTTWTPTAPLPHGRALVWQVAAITDGARVVTPAAGEPEARFRVLSPAERDAATAARTRLAGSRLALGVWLAGAGLLDAAEDELTAVQADNPDVPALTALVDSLRKGRR